MEFLNCTNLEILIKGNDPTFGSTRRLREIDNNLESFELLESLKSWEVSSGRSLSDQRHILFNLGGSVPVCLIRYPRGTTWESFRE